jgi:hypothetical protein
VPSFIEACFFPHRAMTSNLKVEHA